MLIESQLVLISPAVAVRVRLAATALGCRSACYANLVVFVTCVLRTISNLPWIAICFVMLIKSQLVLISAAVTVCVLLPATVLGC